ncbi:MAG: condensation domain-containing protein [Frankiaceae bacterium]
MSSVSPAEPLLPLTEAQQAIWYEEQLGTGESNTGAFSVTIRGHVDERHVHAACAAVVASEPPLRSIVRLVDGQPLLAVLAADHPLDWAVANVPCREGTEQEAARWFQFEAGRRTWDLTADLPICFRLLRHGDERRTLLAIVHHLGFDGRSKHVFARAFAGMLRRIRTGAALPAPCVDGAGHDAAPAGLDEQAELAELTAEARDRWVAADVPSMPPLNLPVVEGDRQSRVRWESFTVAPAERERLSGLAGAAGGTLFAGLLSCLAAQLHLYGNDSVVVCVSADISTPANRDRIGMAVNVVPLLIPVSGDDDLRSVLATAREALAQLKRYRRVPFRKVWARQPWTAAARSLMSTLQCSLLRVPGEVGDVPGLRMEWDFAAPNTAPSFDLMLQFRQVGDALLGRLDYSSRFDQAAARLLTADYRAVLAAALAAPGTALAGLPPLPSAVPALRGPRATAGSAPARATPRHEVASGGGAAVDLVRRWARDRPDDAAVVDESGCVPFARLDRLRAELAERLSVAGVGPGDSVSVARPGTFAGLATLLAAGGLGADVLPGGAAGAPVTRVVAEPEALARGAEGAVRTCARPGAARPDPAWLVPCGAAERGGAVVPLSLRRLADTARWQARALTAEGTRPGAQRVLRLAPPGSPMLPLEWLLAWAAGGAVCLGPGEGWDAGPAAVRAAVGRLAVTTLVMPFHALRALCEAGPLPVTDVITPLPQLRPSAAVRDGLGPARLHAVYAPGIPPGAAPVVAMASLPAAELGPTAYCPALASVAPGTSVGVRTAQGRPLPPGLTGRVTVGVEGDTAPTGDLGRLDRAGRLRYDGRVADTTAWAGLRLDHGALEAFLCAHPDVRDAAVVGRGETVVAHVVPRPGATIDPRAIRGHLKRRRAPREMSVSRVVVVEALPRLADGEIDRGRLRERITAP